MSRTLALLSLTALLGVAPSGLFAKPVDVIRPQIMMPSDPFPVPGETVTYTVVLSGAATSAGYLSISSTTMSNFSALPSQVNYNTGDVVAVFNATVATTASGSIQITASNANGLASILDLIWGL